MSVGHPPSTVRLDASPYGRLVVARLLDFFADTTPWPRRLWEVSSVLALAEAAEAGDWVRARVLSPGALTWYRHALERQLGPDCGLGDSTLRRELTKLLRSDLAPDSRERRRLIQMLPLVRRGYLGRWAVTVDSARKPSAERLTRALATHLLDCGHSNGSLHRWVRALSTNADATLGDLLQAATELADRDDTEFEVLVPFVSIPDPDRLAAHLPQWRSPSATRAWLAEHVAADPPRHNGGFVYRFTAKDAPAAARAAAANVRRLVARRTYARGALKPLVPVGQVWVAGHSRALPLDSPSRGANVLSLESEGTMYVASAGERLDEALELAAPLNDGPLTSAVAGAWAAIETLLSHPGDQADIEEGKVVAATEYGSHSRSARRPPLALVGDPHGPAVTDLLEEPGR